MQARARGRLAKLRAMFLEQPRANAATSRLYQGDIDKRGYVMNLTRLWAWRPDVNDGFIGLRALVAA